MRFVQSIAILLALVGCAGPAAVGKGGAASTSQSEPRAEVVRLRRRTEEQSRRIGELETRITLLEAEARRQRAGRTRPTETVRIGRARDGGIRDEPRTQAARSESVPVLRLVGSGSKRQPAEPLQPLELPQPPPGVPDTLAVAPLPGQAPQPSVRAPVAAKELYVAALRAMRDRRFEAAQEGFARFLQAHPRHALSDKASYWLAEASYAGHDYAGALERFKDVLARYPKSPKAADALLKIGLCHKRLGDAEQAGTYFRKVRKRFPDSSAATIASREGSS